MKTKTLILSVCLSLIALQANALTTEEVKNSEYLINHGHSKEMAKMVNLQTTQVNGEKPPAIEGNVILKWVRKVQSYYDPAYDNGSFGRNDINFDGPGTPADL